MSAAPPAAPPAAAPPPPADAAAPPAEDGQRRSSSSSADEDGVLPDPSGADERDVADEWTGLALEECAQRANELKAEGNDHFKAMRNQEAHYSYEQGIKCLAHHKEKPEAAALLLSLHLNLAAACLRCELWPEAESNATKALGFEAENSKALFRRGVARARQSQLDGAKADLSAACKADPKNREARTELNAVVERISQRKQEEKKAMQGLFSNGGKGLYEDEERKRQAKQAEEKRLAKLKAEEEALKEAALREEWRKECARLRTEEQAQATMAVDGGQADGAEEDCGEPMDVSTEGCEGGSGPEVGDQDEEEAPPITFEDFKKAKEEEEKKAKEAREAEEKRRKDAEDDARRRARAKQEVVKVDDEEDLKGVIRGYKKRADGSTTSYFTREVDPATKAMLDQMKQPKRITPTTAEEAQQSSWSGSAWNKAGTWEERDCSKWAIDTIKTGVKQVVATSSSDASSMAAMLERMKESTLGSENSRGLLDLASELSSEIATASVCITEVKNVEGVASIRSSRGVTKHTYDMSFDADFEITLEQVVPKEEGATKKPPKVKGTLHYTDVSPSSDGPRAEITHKLKKAPADEYAKRVEAAVAELKMQVHQYLRKFDAEFKERTS